MEWSHLPDSAEQVAFSFSSHTCPSAMKLRLPSRLLTALLFALCLSPCHAESDTSALAATLGADWGNTAYIGDSITHGYYPNLSQTYRWQLFKTMVDNGITQNEVGTVNGFYNQAGKTGLLYGGQVFDNRHIAQSGIKAEAVANNIDTTLGKVTDAAGNSAVADTVLLMLGTNDLIHQTLDSNKGMVPENVDTLASLVTGHLGTIVNCVRQSNPNATIIVNALPAWSQDFTDRTGKNADAGVHAAYNAKLQAWAESEGLTFIDVNKGMIDVANTTNPGVAAAGMLVAAGKDGLHPDKQGDLLMAGNLAQQLGYAGRTAGQARMAATAFSHQAAGILAAASAAGTINVTESGSLELGSEAQLAFSWSTEDDTSRGFTVDFGLENGLGNGAEGGWNTSGDLSLSIGDGTHSGTLNINEAYICWGSTILYSADMSDLSESLRVAYVCGSNEAEQNLSSGFYVWLGDMLIGEALGSSGSTNGLTLENGTGNSLTLSHLSLTGSACAPTSERLSYANPLIEPSVPGSVTETTLSSASFGNTASNSIRALSGASSGDVRITVSGENRSTGLQLIASYGAYEGDVEVVLTGKMRHPSGNRYNAAHVNGRLDGSVTLTVAEGFSAYKATDYWGGFVGVDGSGAATTVTGDVNMLFSSAALKVDSTSSQASPWLKADIAGAANNTTVEGSVNITVTAGEFKGSIYGGICHNADSFNGDNSRINGSTNVTVSGGSIGGDIYGGGRAGSILGSSNVTIEGGAMVGGNICAGGSGGTIAGGTTLTVRNVGEGDNFASYNGTLSGGSTGVSGERVLRFEGTALNTFNATLKDFDRVELTGKSEMSLSSTGGAGTLVVDAGSSLTLTSGEHTLVVTNNGTVAVQTGAALSLDPTGSDPNMSGTYKLQGGSLTVGGYTQLAAAFELSSGTFAKQDAATTLSGGVTICAEGNVELQNLRPSDISALSTLSEEACVQGLAGELKLDEVLLTCGATTGASLLFGDNAGSLEVGTLTLCLSEELSAMLVGQSSAQSRARTGALPELIVADAAVTAQRINIQLADGYEACSVSASGIEFRDGYSVINYTVAATIPEPATAVLLLPALAGLAARRRRR